MLSAQEKRKLLDKVIADINKKAGRTVIGRPNDPEMAELTRIDFLPTPSIELNVALGGGFARGKIIELFGEHSSGKTSLALETIALDMKNNPDSYWGWYETEGSFDLEYAMQFDGFDPDRFVLWHIEDEGAEKGLDFLEAMIRTGQFTGIVVNSVAGLTPKSEMESEMEKQSVGLQARMMSKLMRKITGIASKNKCTVIFINQLRTNVGVMYGDPNVTTGGRALSFYASQRINMRRAKLEKSDGIAEDEGIKVVCKVAKNRFATGNQQCSYIALYGKGIDRVRGVANAALEHGFVEQSGAWIYYPTKDNPATLPDGEVAKWQGAAKFLEYLRENPGFTSRLSEEIMQQVHRGKVTGKSLDDEEIAAIRELEGELEEDETLQAEA